MKQRSTLKANSHENKLLRVRFELNKFNYVRINKNLQRVLITLMMFLMSSFIFGQSPPTLGTTSTYALFTAVGAFSNDAASTVVTGDVGTNAGAFTAFPPGTLIGQKHVADPGSVQAAIDVNTAYSYLFGLTCGETIGTSLGNGQSLTPKVYCLGAASTLNGNLVLDGGGDPNALFIFKIDGALATSTNSLVTLKGVSPCNVYWQINGAFTLGNNSVFVGTLLINGAIHLLDGSSLSGRALSREGAIDLHNNVVTVPNCNVSPCPEPTITGPAKVCETSTGNVYTTEPGMTNYVWAVPSGGTITSGGTSGSNTVTVTWNTAGAQTVSVNYTTASGCTPASPKVYNVTVVTSWVPSVTGPPTACVTSSGNVYTTEPGMLNYVWTVSSGGTITSGGTPTSNTVTVTWNTDGAQTVGVNYTSTTICSVASPAVYDVLVSPCTGGPCPVPTITGPAAVCESYCTVYTTEPGMTNYLWTISSGGTVPPACITSSIVTVCWNTPGHQTLSVTYTNPNCTAESSSMVFDVIVSPSLVPALTGPETACVNSTGNVYITEPDMTNYGWTVPSGGTITSGGTPTSNTVTVTWNTAGAHTVGVTYTNDEYCTVATPTVYSVTVNKCIGPCPVPTITGPTAVCQSFCTVYTTEPGMTNYLWKISSGGTVPPACLTSSTVTVCWNETGHQTLSVTYTDPNGCPESSSLVYDVTVAPSMVPAITGPASASENSCNNVYTTESGMTNYKWTISAGGTIAPDCITTGKTITVCWNKPGNQTVSVTYTNDNNCTVETPTVYNVTVYPIPPAPVVTLNGDVLVSSSPTGNQWYSGTTGDIPGATDQSYTVTNNTDWYWCTVTMNGFTSPVSNKVYNVISSVPELPADASFSIYPQPNDGHFTVKIQNPADEILAIEVYNMFGSKVYELRNVKLTGGRLEQQIDLPQLANGIYSIVFRSGEHKVFRKILVQK